MCDGQYTVRTEQSDGTPVEVSGPNPVTVLAMAQGLANPFTPQGRDAGRILRHELRQHQF